ncbi:hypothetical protein SAMN05421538_103224 [Paracoccus isoporae]|uniref:Uncharacterized protein n=1 Tax=Paracoccus isoporae TaxID=591205 RepID=A0A1G6ZE85_9RHOB|nr:hypothetical protein [Paracoccus isoporae]SDE00507.1 hypothetical protein SAMN05421538_103224 [Paracoccus isoporae]
MARREDGDAAATGTEDDRARFEAALHADGIVLDDRDTTAALRVYTGLRRAAELLLADELTRDDEPR